VTDVSNEEAERVALRFTRALCDRDYAGAHAMGTAAYRAGTTVDQLQGDFEAIVPTDWGPFGPIEVVRLDLPGVVMPPGRVYVSIGGDVYSEAVVVTVENEGGELRVAAVEFGRP